MRNDRTLPVSPHALMRKDLIDLIEAAQQNHKVITDNFLVTV
jgi:hypothetical protein